MGITNIIKAAGTAALLLLSKSAEGISRTQGTQRYQPSIPSTQFGANQSNEIVTNNNNVTVPNNSLNSRFYPVFTNKLARTNTS